MMPMTASPRTPTGSKEFKAALVKDYVKEVNARQWEGEGKQEIQQLQWTHSLTNCLRVLGQPKSSVQTERKSAPWKVAVATHLKQTTQASNGWLAEQLHMGSAVAVSQYVGQLHRAGGKAAPLLKLLTERINT